MRLQPRLKLRLNTADVSARIVDDSPSILIDDERPRVDNHPLPNGRNHVVRLERLLGNQDRRPLPQDPLEPHVSPHPANNVLRVRRMNRESHRYGRTFVAGWNSKKATASV